MSSLNTHQARFSTHGLQVTSIDHFAKAFHRKGNPLSITPIATLVQEFRGVAGESQQGTRAVHQQAKRARESVRVEELGRERERGTALESHDCPVWCAALTKREREREREGWRGRCEREWE